MMLAIPMDITLDCALLMLLVNPAKLESNDY